MMENLWGIGGVFALLFGSSINLFYKASGIFYYNVKYEEYWIAYSCTCIVFLLGEGRSFHKKFNPFVIERSKLLSTEPVLAKIFAPFYCMGHIYSNKKIKSWICTGIICLLSYLINFLPFLCRMAIDAAVAFALLFGSCSLIYLAQSQ